MEDRTERLEREKRELVEALEELLHEYVEVAESGDCGRWNPEDDPAVIRARAALAKVRRSTPEPHSSVYATTDREELRDLLNEDPGGAA